MVMWTLAGLGLCHSKPENKNVNVQAILAPGGFHTVKYQNCNK